MPETGTLRLVAGSAALGLALSAGSLAAAGPWDNGQRKAEREWAAVREATGGAHHGDGRAEAGPRAPAAAPSAPGVLVAAGTTASAPDARALAAALDPLVKSPALGTAHSAAVVDAATGRLLYGSDEDEQLAPASVTKIATAVAALTALGPEHRISTPVVRDGSDRLFLVGAGDASLDDARLKRLASDTARVLGRGARVALAYDTSRFTGPVRHPLGVNPNIAPVTALTVDEGRLDGSDHGPAERSADPAKAAGERFAELLRDEGVRVDGVKPGKAPGGADPVAATASPTVAELVERMLTHSDNDLAESLARQTALATDEKPDFDGSARAVQAQLDRLDLPGSSRIADGSGLDRSGRLSASRLAALLARAAGPDHAALRPALTGLPVAGFTGTLQKRYGKGSAGTGLVRAKTGTLTGVNTLAGTVLDTEGRLLSFAFLTSGTTDPQAAQHALDTLATKVAACGCR
ncbi:D-alanyl-D-alanine carboxypeptidase/D-alanyl-D-alanine-endopeptidase [Streptomyces sp. NPDC060194]|uniref:D-alanyl-D-alanine carboxypeptidase/D-alanyl-D-alanine endopeptidase n=1 Tax=Streptomyces sp. NPDC060194 TaxID=3347069 RepID=UPI0036619BE2